MAVNHSSSDCRDGSTPTGKIQCRYPSDHIIYRSADPGQRHILDRGPRLGRNPRLSRRRGHDHNDSDHVAAHGKRAEDVLPEICQSFVPGKRAPLYDTSRGRALHHHRRGIGAGMDNHPLHTHISIGQENRSHHCGISI